MGFNPITVDYNAFFFIFSPEVRASYDLKIFTLFGWAGAFYLGVSLVFFILLKIFSYVVGFPCSLFFIHHDVYRNLFVCP